VTDYAGIGFLYSTSDTAATFDLYGVTFPYSTSDTAATFDLYGVTFPYSTSDTAATFDLYGVGFPYSVPNTNDIPRIDAALVITPTITEFGQINGFGTLNPLQIYYETHASLTIPVSIQAGDVGIPLTTQPLLVAGSANNAYGTLNSLIVTEFGQINGSGVLSPLQINHEINANLSIPMSMEASHLSIPLTTQSLLSAGGTNDAHITLSPLAVTEFVQINGSGVLNPLQIYHEIHANLIIPMGMEASNLVAQQLTIQPSLIVGNWGINLIIIPTLTATHYCELRLDLPAIYRCVLSGGDLPPLILPLSSFQAKLTLDAYAYLTVVIPGILKYINDIQARQEDGFLTIEKGYHLPSGDYFDSLIKSRFEDFSYDLGVRTSSGTLRGYYTAFATRNTTRKIEKYNYLALRNGLKRIRLPIVDTYIRPGDYAVVDEVGFTIREISYTVSVGSAVMEIAE